MGNETLETRYDDLPLSAFLILSGFTLLRIERHPSKPGLSVFVFAFKKDIGEATFRFYRNEAKIEPRSYLNLIRDLKRGQYAI